MKKALFIDRDGTLIVETDDQKIEKFEKLKFYPEVFYWLGKIVREFDYELVMVTNQDGLGKPDFTEEDFNRVQNFILQTFKDEKIAFAGVHIDRSYPEEGLPTRKPGTGMLLQYMNGHYDLKNSFVIGDRITDVMLAKNLGCKCLWLNNGSLLGATEIGETVQSLKPYIAVEATGWQAFYEYLKSVQ